LGEHARNAAPGLVLGVGLLVRVVFLAGVDEPALVRVVPDDAYYYLKVARNVVAGQGATFDAIHPTNGYHPLWLGALVPVAWVVREPLAFVRAALGLGVGLSFLTAILLHRLVRRITGSWWIPLLALILYWLNPRAVASSLNGLESSLSTLLFTVLLWGTLRIADRRSPTADWSRESGVRNPEYLSVAFGVLMGLLFLARTDNVFFIGVFWLAAVAMAERGRRLRRAGVMAAAAAALAVPWAAYNWLAFGSPVQVSGLAVPYVQHALYRPEEHGGLSPTLHGLKLFAVMLYEGLRGEIGYSRLVSFPAIALSLLVFAICWRREAALDADPARSMAARRAILVLLGLGLASFAHLFVHAAIRWYPRPWYFDQLLVLLPAVFALALSVATRRAQLPGAESRVPVAAPQEPGPGDLAPCSHPVAQSAIRNPRLLGALVALALAGIGGLLVERSAALLRRGEWPWAVEMLDAARWLRDNTREGDVAAAFNAGIIGYYSQRRVVNLDGAVNNAAYEALRHRSLLSMMRRAKVAYYLDFEPMTLKRFGPFLGALRDMEKMPVVHRFRRPEAAWAGSHILVVKMHWSHEGTKED